VLGETRLECFIRKHPEIPAALQDIFIGYPVNKLVIASPGSFQHKIISKRINERSPRLKIDRAGFLKVCSPQPGCQLKIVGDFPQILKVTGALHSLRFTPYQIDCIVERGEIAHIEAGKTKADFL